MIRSRCVGNQPDSILFLERPTHFPRALALRFTARFCGPSTLFTVCTAQPEPSKVAECCSLEGFAPRVETAGAGLGGTKACAKHQHRPVCTAQPTLLNHLLVDQDLGFPGDDHSGMKCDKEPFSKALLHLLLTLPPEYGIATGNDECLRCTTFAPPCRDHPGLTEGEISSEEWFFLSQTRAMVQKP